MDIDSKLTHTADVYIQGTVDNAGIPSYSLNRNIKCYVWGVRSRTLVGSQPQSSFISISFRAIVLGTESFNVNDQLRNVLDVNGDTVLEQGTVIQVSPIVKRSGILTKELDITLQ
jgi:hypothetical protein